MEPTIAYQYDPCKMCQINAFERAANHSRLRESRLMLKLYGHDAQLSMMLLVFDNLNFGKTRPIWPDLTIIQKFVLR